MAVDPRLVELASARGAVAAAEGEVTSQGASLARAKRALETATRLGNTAGVTAARTEINRTTSLLSAARTLLTGSVAKVEQLRSQLTNLAPVASEFPTVLFPVRLEARFRFVPFNFQLLIRIYPDDLHIDTHEPALTDDEVADGRSYWAVPEPRLDAWRSLSTKYGASRAAWISRATENAAVDPPRRAAAWTRAPRTASMPDRFTAICYGADGTKIATETGAQIPDLLQVGPAPDDGSAPPANPSTMDPVESLDEGMRWLVDFQKAIQAGMGIIVNLPGGVAAVERLVVYGVKSSMDPEASTQLVESLTDAHHYTRTLSFLRRGTPTNNTAEAASGFDSRDLGQEKSYATECKGALFTAGSGANGDVTSRLLGVRPGVLANVEQANSTDDAAAQQMQTALWSATWGYFLDKRLTGAVSADGLRQFRRYFIDHVRPGGPLPSLRIGNQPYGLLPVTSLDHFVQDGAGDVAIRAIQTLQNLRVPFRAAAAKAPKIGLATPDQDLLNVLRAGGKSSAYILRHVAGPWFADNFYTFAGTSTPREWWDIELQYARTYNSVAGLPDVTPQITSLLENVELPLSLPLVQADSSKPQLDPNYGTLLANATLAQLRADTVLPAGSVRPLLYRMLRHSLMLEYATAGQRLQVRAGMTPAQDEPELVDIDTPGATQTVWRQLDFTLPAITGALKIGEFLDNPSNESHEDVRDLAACRASLRGLGARPVRELEQLLPETIDACSHRLDAWITSVATRRLSALRVRTARGLCIGAYGWLENLAAGTAQTSEGFIHAPSLTHASAAAVLANGYLSHKTGSANNPFALDLSSSAVRTVREIIAGVRQGQPLAALLGYRLERALVDAGLARFIEDLRWMAPLGSSNPTPEGTTESVAANNVVHGLNIIKMMKSNHPQFSIVLMLKAMGDYPRIRAMVAELDAIADALGDALIAENVFQVTRGNFQRAGFTFDAIANGQSVPDPEVLDFPRTGTVSTHRVAAFLAPETPQVAQWPVNPMQVRANAEPRLNAWAASLLPNPAAVRCRVEYLHPDTGKRLATLQFALPVLQVSPLDAVFSSSTGRPGEQAEMEQRMAYHALRNRPTNVPPNARVRVEHGRVATWAPGIISTGEFLEVAAAVRKLMATARVISAADLTPAGAQGSGPGEPDVVEVTARADALVAALRAAQIDLVTATASDPETLRDRLLRLAWLGLSTAMPLSAAGTLDSDKETLVEQAGRVARDAADRLRRVDRLLVDGGASVQERVEIQVERIRVVLGSEFPVVPMFAGADLRELKLSLSVSTATQGGDALAALFWLGRMARVRERVRELTDVLRYTEVLSGRGNTPQVAQLPWRSGERWVALPGGTAGGRTSLIIFGGANAVAGQPLAGIVFDEWNETVPRARETTGVTFHYDAPGARPPQAVLLAVAPDLTRPWDAATIESILLETMELVRFRAVDQESLTQLDQYLPALCFALNAAGDTVSTDFREA